MDTIVEEIGAEVERLPLDIDAHPLVEAAVALRPVLRQYQDEIEREQRMPPSLVGQLREAGFYKMVIPRALGGLQVDTLTYLRVVETLAEGAGSVGWNLGNGGVGQLGTLRLPRDGGQEIYSERAGHVLTPAPRPAAPQPPPVPRGA